MIFNVAIKSHSDDLQRGDLVYHAHELLRVTFVGKWRYSDGRTERYYRFRRVGKINLDRERRFGRAESGGRE